MAAEQGIVFHHIKVVGNSQLDIRHVDLGIEDTFIGFGWWWACRMKRLTSDASA